MSWGLHDALGTLGAGVIVLCYLALQTGRISTRRPSYSLLNAGGASLILLSLSQKFNLAAFLIEFFWLLISLYGLARALRLRASRLRLLRLQMTRFRTKHAKNRS